MILAWIGGQGDRLFAPAPRASNAAFVALQQVVEGFGRGDSNKSRFERNLREMVADKFIGQAANGAYLIMPRGQALVTKKSLLTYRP